MSASVAQLTENDRRLIAHEPVGIRFYYIVVALTKRFLLSSGLKSKDKLYLLEKMHSLIDYNFKLETVAAIDPAGDLEEQIFKEAKTLDGPRSDDRLPASFDLLTRDHIFSHFVTLNPGMLAAIRQREQRYGTTTA